MSLSDVKQAGATGIVSALYHIANGNIWTIDEINKQKAIIERAGLVWDVVESMPVPENIKRRSEDFKQYIENHEISIENLAK